MMMVLLLLMMKLQMIVEAVVDVRYDSHELSSLSPDCARPALKFLLITRKNEIHVLFFFLDNIVYVDPSAQFAKINFRILKKSNC